MQDTPLVHAGRGDSDPNASGLVTGVAEGTATITASAGSGQGTAEITVMDPDRAVLVALYEATDGPNWLNNEGWLTDAPLGEWYGVETDGQGRVTGLNLGGTWNPETGWERNNVTGSIPSELGNLSELRWLDLVFNRLTGPIPSELGNLTNLTQLQLSSNDLTGPIPPELVSLANLTVLDLSLNELTGPIPPWLGSLANLQTLSLYNNVLTGPIPPELGHLTNLQSVYLNWNDLAGPLPPELGNLSRLRDLSVFGNYRLVGPLPETYTGLDSLVFLSIERTDLCIPQTTEFQLWLRAIERVEGENCSIVQESDREALAAIYRWTNGDGWRSNNNWLGDGPLDDWYGVTVDNTDRVTALDLSDNNLEGFVPAETGDLLYIEKLVLNGNSALGEELSPRMLQLVFLSTLWLDGTGVCTSAAPEFLDWLDRIADARVAACPDDHGNDATEATSIAVGQRAEGELESYLDEDWFRFEVGEWGAVTVAAESNIEVDGELYDGEGTRVGYDGWFQDFSISRHVTPGTYYVRVTGRTEEARGS